MYPIMLELTGKKIVIIGGGKIALRKTLGVLKGQGKVTVVAPKFLEAFYQLEDVQLVLASYTAEAIKDAQLIFACTDSKEVNRQIVKDTSDSQWVNECSQKEHSDFFNMSTIEQKEFLIALSSYGENPTETKKMKERLMTFLELTE